MLREMSLCLLCYKSLMKTLFSVDFSDLLSSESLKQSWCAREELRIALSRCKSLSSPESVFAGIISLLSLQSIDALRMFFA